MESARERVAILLNDVLHSAVLNFGCVLAQEFFGLNSSFQGLKFVWWWGTDPVKEMIKKGKGSVTKWTGLWLE